MATPHINAKDGAFAKVVLMPGDPYRAKWMAETFLHKYELVTDVRGILGFTGYTENGYKISIMASGMGIPSISIYSTELFSGYGVEAIIRVGTCGTYQPEINLRDILVCLSSSSDSNFAGQYNLNGQIAACADFDLTCMAVESVKERKLGLHIGNILSADVFYDYDKNVWKKWADLGVMGVEMEAYGLYLVANAQKKKALTILTVTDSFVKHEKMTSAERQTGLIDMIKVGVSTAEKYLDSIGEGPTEEK